MKILPILFSVLFASVFIISAPPESYAQNPRKIIEREDADGDKRVSRDEFQGRPSNFEKIDSNGGRH